VNPTATGGSVRATAVARLWRTAGEAEEATRRTAPRAPAAAESVTSSATTVADRPAAAVDEDRHGIVRF